MPIPKIRFEKYFLLIIILFAAIPRIIIVSSINVSPFSDFDLYHSLAKSLSQGVASTQEYIALFPHVVGYPYILSFFYKIFGAYAEVAQGLNILFSIGIAILIYLICKIKVNSYAAIFASILWCLWPTQMFYCELPCTEYTFTFFMLLTVYLFLVFTEAPVLKSNPLFLALCAIVIGVLLAVTNAIRPTGIILLLGMLILIFLMKYKKRELIYRFLLVLVIGVSFLIVSKTISGNVERLIDRKVAQSPIGFNLYVGMNYDSKGGWNLEDSTYLSELLKKHNGDVNLVHTELLNGGIQRFFSRDIGKNLELFMIKSSKMWGVDNDASSFLSIGEDKNNFGIINVTQSLKLLDSISNTYYWLCLLMCLLILIYKLFLKRFDKIDAFIALILLFNIGLFMLMEVQPRYHFPIVSLLAIFIGKNSYSIFTFRKRSDML
ncbi:MAG: glycosyltransferase family 39 protein [Bacillota bacterium]